MPNTHSVCIIYRSSDPLHVAGTEPRLGTVVYFHIVPFRRHRVVGSGDRIDNLHLGTLVDSHYLSEAVREARGVELSWVEGVITTASSCDLAIDALCNATTSE